MHQTNFNCGETPMKKYINILISILALSFAGTAIAEKDYELVKPPQLTQTGDKIEVLEFFWYGCPHCNKFEPFVQNWLKTKPNNVEFIKVPATLNPRWVDDAKAYYAAQLLGVEHQFTQAFFNARHKERKRFHSLDEIADFASKKTDVSKSDFLDAMSSSAVATKVNRATQLATSYGIDGVPAVVVNGKYKTSASVARGHAGVIKAINKLIAMESK